MWVPTISSDELYHHGILGMKWGKRNGPPYPLKANQHSAEEKKVGWKKSLDGGRNTEMYSRGKDDKKSPYEKIPDATSKAAESATRLTRKAARKDRKKLQEEVDVSNMSTHDLERYIRRERLEQEYKDIKTKDVELGKEKLADVLDTVKDVSAVAASVATIAVAIARLKGIPPVPVGKGKDKQGGFLADRKANKEYKREIINKAVDYDDDYDKTPEGKKLKADYTKAIRKMENTYDDDDPYENPNHPFYKTEEKYLRSQQRYTAAKLLDEYGPSGLKRFIELDTNRTVNTDDPNKLIQMYEDLNWHAHAY